MAMKICCHCGTAFSEVYAKIIVDNNYGFGKYNWICSQRGEMCPSCAAEEITLFKQESDETADF